MRQTSSEPDAARRSEQHARLWRLLVRGAMRYRSVWLAEDGAATSVWIPPGGSELTPEDEAALESMVVDLLGPGAGRVLGAFEAFDRAPPATSRAGSCTLLGTDPRRRGRGHGLALLAANLRVVDAAGLPALPGGQQHGERAALPALRLRGARLLPDARGRTARSSRMWRPAMPLD